MLAMAVDDLRQMAEDAGFAMELVQQLATGKGRELEAARAFLQGLLTAASPTGIWDRFESNTARYRTQVFHSTLRSRAASEEKFRDVKYIADSWVEAEGQHGKRKFAVAVIGADQKQYLAYLTGANNREIIVQELETGIWLDRNELSSNLRAVLIAAVNNIPGLYIGRFHSSRAAR